MKKILLMSLFSVFIIAACSTNSSEIESFTHIHGLDYSQTDESFYLSSHMGLINVNEGSWNLTGEPESQHDLMGFTILDEETMISSGHPSLQSDLANPLGVVISEDQGESWEPIALYEEVDFHHLHVNERDPNVMYGTDVTNSNFYKSENGGYDWEVVETSGLTDDLTKVLSLTSHPQNPNNLLAGTESGIFISEDGGKTWEQRESTFSATALTTVNADSEELVAYLVGENEGLFYSEDFGETWETLNFQLENDAVTIIANHPTDEARLLIGSAQQSIYETLNFGESWETLAEGGTPSN